MKGHILISDTTHPSYERIVKLADELSLGIAHAASECTGGTWLFMVSCSEFVKRKTRDKYEHALVLHASDLPRGRGWSPWVHEIRGGAEVVWLSMLTASDSIDSGAIWEKRSISIGKHWLYNRIVDAITAAECKLIRRAVRGEIDPAKAWEQTGEVTSWRKLDDHDSMIGMNMATFNKIRTCDPSRFPAWFSIDGKRYTIKIEEA